METELLKDIPKQNESNDIIEKAKISEASGKSNFMDPQVKTQKKRGPKPKSEKINAQDVKSDPVKEVPKFNIPTAVICVPFARGISSLGVSYTNDPRAGMGPKELEEIATAMGYVLDKYLPDAANKYGPELMLSFALGQYGLRLMAIKKLQAINQQNQRPKENTVKPDQQQSPSPVIEVREQVDATVNLDNLVENQAHSIIP